jgi:hypothetical protein
MMCSKNHGLMATNAITVSIPSKVIPANSSHIRGFMPLVRIEQIVFIARGPRPWAETERLVSAALGVPAGGPVEGGVMECPGQRAQSHQSPPCSAPRSTPCRRGASASHRALWCWPRISSSTAPGWMGWRGRQCSGSSRRFPFVGVFGPRAFARERLANHLSVN